MKAAKSRQVRGRVLANRLILAILILAVLAGLYGLGTIIRPMSVSAAATSAATGPRTVRTALLACPAVASGGQSGNDIAIVNTPAGSSGGQLVLSRLSPSGSAAAPAPLSASPLPGELSITRVGSARAVAAKRLAMPAMAGGLVPTTLATGGLTIQAAGRDAQGLDAEQLDPAGLPATGCQAPGSDFWFAGPSAPTMNVLLYLVNVDSQPADASVSVQTDSGPSLGTPDSGIVVPPHAMVVQNLSHMLHAARAFTLNVTTSAGRVVAAVRESTGPGRQGIWLPVGEAATSQVLAGLPSGAGSRELYIAVPGATAAQVKVTVMTPRGSYQPTGGSDISLLGHLTTGISLPSLAGIPGAVRVSSNVPVVAVLEAAGGPPGAPGAFAGPSGPLVQQGVLAASPVGHAGQSDLVLSAPGKAASVRVVQALPGTSLAGLTGQVVRIPAGSSTQVRIALPKRARGTLVALVVTPLPGSGPVYAARVALAGGSVQTIEPVPSAPTSVLLPPVRQSLVAVLGQSSSG